MTLIPYDSNDLDALSLRVLDMCGRVRALARRSRDEELPALQLHDRKALEWLKNLEAWLADAEAELHRVGHRADGARRAKEVRAKRAK